MKSFVLALLVLIGCLGQARADCAQYSILQYDPADTLTCSKTIAGVPFTTFREVLSADRTYTVNKDTGSDSNNCTAVGTACLTIQGAINKVKAVDLGGHLATVNVTCTTPPCTYTIASGGNVVAGPWIGATPTGTGIAGKCAVTFIGDNTTPTNVLVQTSDSSSVFTAADGGSLCIKGFQLKSTGGGALLDAIRSGEIIVTGNMNFNSTTFYHVIARRNSYIEFQAAYTISGNALAHWQSNNNSNLIAQSLTITVAGGLTFSNAFAGAIAISNLVVNGNTFSTIVATGTKFNAQLLSAINTVGGGVEYFPGTAGSCNPVSACLVTGSQYQ